MVFASPFFLVHNYILFPIIMWTLHFIMLILYSNGDMPYAFCSFNADNIIMFGNMMRLARYILMKAVDFTCFLFYSVDLSITILLILGFAYEEVKELIIFLLSNEFMVSLLYSHASTPRWHMH